MPIMLARSTAVLRFTTAAALAIGLVGASAAQAATITEDFTFTTVTGYETDTGTAFSAFDPSLGTLNSVTYNFTATADFTGGGSTDFNVALYNLMFTGPSGFSDQSISGSSLGNGSGPASISGYTVGNPNIDAFFGPGLVTPSVAVENTGGTSASIVSTFGPESVTYNYTPVPEPATWAMMLAGFAGLGFAGYRRGRRLA